MFAADKEYLCSGYTLYNNAKDGLCFQKLVNDIILILDSR